MSLPSLTSRVQLQDDDNLSNASVPRPAGLLQLSNELIIPIIARTYHQDLVNLALSCKLLYALAKSALRVHRALMQELSIQTTYHNPRHFSKVLRSVLEEPGSGLYVRELVFRPSGFWSPDPGKTTDDKWLLAKAKESPFKDFIDKLVADLYGESNPGVKQDLLRSIARGKHLPIVAFLCAILPNLSRLEIYTYFDSVRLQLELLDLVLQSRHLTKVDGSHFSNLRSVEIHGITGPCENTAFGILKTCAHIPSMWILVGVGFVLNGYQTKTEWVSSVKSLALQRCAIDELTIRHMVLGMKHLKQFTYTQRDSGQRPQPRPSLGSLCAALLDCAQGTLERLEITGLDRGILDMDTYEGCLLHFASLHDVTVEYSSLLRAQHVLNRWSCGLYAHLPDSIRKVELDCWSLQAGYRYRPRIISCLLEVLLDESAPSLSNLECLGIASLDERTVDNLIEARYVDRLAAAGIQLNFDNVHSPDDYSDSVPFDG